MNMLSAISTNNSGETQPHRDAAAMGLRVAVPAAVDVSLHHVDRRSFDRSVAYHEAGHCAASRLLGLPVTRATVEYVDGHWGCTWSDEQPSEAPVADLVAQLMPMIGDDRLELAADLLKLHHTAISLLAGPLAEEMFCGRRLPGSEHDDEEAAQLAKIVCRSPTSDVIEAYLAFCAAEARALLARHATAVEAVANALIGRRTMSGTDIDRLLASIYGRESGMARAGPSRRPRYVLTLTPLPGVDPIRALRWALKGLLRQHGLRCVDIVEVGKAEMPVAHIEEGESSFQLQP